MNIEAANEILRENALGLIRHDFNGLCPDAVAGPDIRDPACTVCKALIVTEDGDLAAEAERASQWVEEKEQTFSARSLF